MNENKFFQLMQYLVRLIKLLIVSKILSESFQIQCEIQLQICSIRKYPIQHTNGFYVLFCTRDKFYSGSIVQNLITFLENEILRY